MRVFVTGASGFIGTELVKELIAAGHQVLGLARTEQGAEHVRSLGAEALLGSFTDLDCLRKGATGVDAVAHLAFNHDDWSQFVKNAEDEKNAIRTLGETLEPGKLLVVTSGTGLATGAPGHVRTEFDAPVESTAVPRRPEQTAKAFVEKGINVAIVRLPQVHDTRKQGLVTPLIQLARAKGVSAYVGDGSARWPAAPLASVGQLYRLALEKTGRGFTVYNAVDEEGVTAKDIAEAVARGLNIPAVSIPADKAIEHFGPFFAHFAAFDMPASSAWTRETLSWNPSGPTMIEDLNNMKF